MAAPSNVRVEAQSLTSAVLRWSYSGSNFVEVYRSTDGSSYASITTDGNQIAPSTTSYTDSTLDSATKYWYKLTDDAGSTFSSVVTVYAMSCGSSASSGPLQMPQATGDQPTADEFNELSQKVETGLNIFKSASGQTCVACISDGALVIDCINYDGCDQIDVEVDQDVNSISMPNCSDAIKQINFIVPPNTTRKICGFPAGMGFSGDECFQAPISGGSSGTTMGVPTRGGDGKPSQSKTGVRGGGSGGGGGGGSGCTCVPGANGELTIKSCNANNSLNCSSTKSLRLLVCGGRGPYSWSRTGSIQLKGPTGSPGSTASGISITVTPPTNSGSAVSGTAYQINGYSCTFCPNSHPCAISVSKRVLYNCDDTVQVCGALSNVCGPTVPTDATCHDGGCSPGELPDCNPASCPDAGMGGLVTSSCDARTAGMISNGCNPCGLQAGATVTVTDALGTQTTIVLRA